MRLPTAIRLTARKMTLRSAWRSLAITAAVLIVYAGLPARAQDVERGRLLARDWCGSCHVTESGMVGSDTAPPFATIAKDPSSTLDRLHHWLVAPHPPMPDLKLSRDEEDDILAYLLSLK